MSTRSLNKVMLIGNLTRDVELKYTAKGTPVATFGIATNRSYTDSSGNQVESAEFTNVVAWSKLAEICEKLLKKGMKVYIEGRLSTTSWDDQSTGKKMYKTEVVATDMMVLGYPKGMDAGQADVVVEDKSDDEFDLSDFDVAEDTQAEKNEDEKKPDENSDEKEEVSGEDVPF